MTSTARSSETTLDPIAHASLSGLRLGRTRADSSISQRDGSVVEVTTRLGASDLLTALDG